MIARFSKFVFKFVRLIPKRIIELVKTGTDVVTTATSGGGIFLPQNEASRRLEVCRACELYDKDGTCGVCTCYVSTKTKFRAAKCPHPNGSKW